MTEASRAEAVSLIKTIFPCDDSPEPSKNEAIRLIKKALLKNNLIAELTNEELCSILKAILPSSPNGDKSISMKQFIIACAMTDCESDCFGFDNLDAEQMSIIFNSVVGSNEPGARTLAKKVFKALIQKVSFEKISEDTLYSYIRRVLIPPQTDPSYRGTIIKLILLSLAT